VDQSQCSLNIEHQSAASIINTMQHSKTIHKIHSYTDRQTALPTRKKTENIGSKTQKTKWSSTPHRWNIHRYSIHTVVHLWPSPLTLKTFSVNHAHIWIFLPHFIEILAPPPPQWVPASAEKAKVGMVHSVSGCMWGVQCKQKNKDPLRPARLTGSLCISLEWKTRGHVSLL